MSNRKLSPGDIIIYREHFSHLVSVPWKPGLSLGRVSQYYEYLIVDDMKKAEAFIPFKFEYERDSFRTVINVNKNKKEMECHARDMGLEVKYTGTFWPRLVISKAISIEPPSCKPPETSSYELPSCEPPPYESSSCEPPLYNSVIDSSKDQDVKLDVKEK